MVLHAGERRWFDVELAVWVEVMPEGCDQSRSKPFPDLHRGVFVGVPLPKVDADAGAKSRATTRTVIHQLEQDTFFVQRLIRATINIIPFPNGLGVVHSWMNVQIVWVCWLMGCGLDGLFVCARQEVGTK
jgi:hypothetical protein